MRLSTSGQCLGNAPTVTPDVLVPVAVNKTLVAALVQRVARLLSFHVCGTATP